MAYVRILPPRRDGTRLWAATVYTPAGRITQTDRLESVVRSWAAERESEVRRADFLDPRRARTTVHDVWSRFATSRRLELASRKRDESQWRCHVEPRWGDVPVGLVLKPDVAAWVNELEAAGVGGWTIIGSLNVLKAVLELAVDAGMIRANTARRVKAPLPPKHVDRLIEPDERTLMLKALSATFPGRRDAAPFVEGLLETGARWEELAAVPREAIDLRQGVIRFGPVMERDGTIRPYPKGARGEESAGFRPVPISDGYVATLRPLVDETARGGLVFTASLGGVMRYPTWLRRVWKVAVAELVELPLPTPHDCRHTYGTMLAEAGLEPHDRMALMGHEDERSSRRYTHSDERKRLERARAALAAR
jgi:integrase